MSWTPLRSRLQQLPLILAGPVLRRTEPEAVTVWLALKQACQVTLEVYATVDGDGLVVDRTPVLQGTHNTVAVGQYLHLVAVTARSTNRQRLQSKQVYVYDLQFEQIAQAVPPAQIFGDQFRGDRCTLYQALTSEAVPLVSVSYFNHELPSFALPPEDLADLRIVHGSCRKPHGGGCDVLPVLDQLIERHCTQAEARPHQLFLSGDQIYGDDVADPLLLALTDAGNTLLGWEEALPVPTNSEPNLAKLTLKDLKPGQRSKVAESLGGFTAGLENKPELAKSHLFGLGEYAATYLFVWSQVLWTELPNGSEVHRNSKQIKTWNRERKSLQDFWQTLGQVRRALANIPTYMICDDHDVSDDWCLNQAWCRRVFGQPLGRRVVQNGLTAYALFQAWGNTAAQFEADQPGGALLQAVTDWSASAGTNLIAEKTIARCLGMPRLDNRGQPQFRPDGKVLILDREAGYLTWNYVVRGPRHEVVVFDTRMWRGYPINEPENAPPMLLSPTAFDRQLRQPLQQTTRQQSGQFSIEATFIVAPTNLVTLEAVELIQHWSLKQGSSFNNDVGDSWNHNKYAIARLLNTLFEQRDRIIVLSGDIHYGSTVCLDHWSRSRSKTGVPSVETSHVLVQLTSSAFKNAEGKTRIAHTKLKSLLSDPTQDWAGWHHQPDLVRVRSRFGIGQLKALPETSCVPVVKRLNRIHRADSAWDLAVKHPNDLPDWRYHVSWMKRQPAEIIFAPIKPARSPKSWFQRVIDWLLKLVWNNRWLQEGDEVVGLNNLGLVQINGSPQSDRAIVSHCLYWHAPWQSGAIAVSRYEAPLQLKAPPPELTVKP
ncbi:MAG: hypothetical protein Kow00121_11470 [Elainellaceae cyanobacterium]